MKGEKEEKQICEIILNSKLSYWEVLGMLEHIKIEFKRLLDEFQKIKKKSKE